MFPGFRVPCLWCSLTLVSLVSGCSALDFDRDFDAAVAHGSLDDRTGPWDGSWKSHVNGHHGSLRCIVREIGLNEYEGRFKAIFGGFIPYVYTTKMQGAMDGRGTLVSGRAQLPGYGTYTWTGEMTGEAFTAEYHTEKDKGSFTMTRPGRAPIAR